MGNSKFYQVVFRDRWKFSQVRELKILLENNFFIGLWESNGEGS